MWPFSKSKKEVVEIQVDDGKGGIVWKKVDKARFDDFKRKALESGAATVYDSCAANILDLDGEHKETWIIGRDISQEVFEKVSENGEVFAIRFYEKGLLQTQLAPKDGWYQARKKMNG